MKFGIIGCRHGHIEEFIREMLELGHSFIGICEREGRLAPALAEKYGALLTEEPEDIWKQNPDIIGSSAVNNQKIHVLEECAARGVHFMVDKPIVTCREGLQKAEAIIKEGRIQVGMQLTERYNPGIVVLKRAIAAGELGKLIGFTIMKPHKLSPASRDAWHFSRKENGGLVVDLMIHDFDLLRWLTGSEIAAVSGYMQIGNWEGYPDFPDDARVLVKMADGSTASLQSDWWTPAAYPCYGKGLIICTGTRGKCIVHTTGDPLFYPGHGSFAQLTTAEKEWGILPDPEIKGTLTGDFLDRIAGKPGLLTGEDILRASEAAILADEQVEVIRRN